MKRIDGILYWLISRGYLYAKYVGPEPKGLPKPCTGVGDRRDPWLQDPLKSGLMKKGISTMRENPTTEIREPV